jgi:formylglycine-generating enzyme required for sulfatase activity
MGKNWAMVIGINRYDYLQSLQYAQRDAQAMRDYFRNEVQFEQIYYFAADATAIPAGAGTPLPAQPTYNALKRFLRVRFEEPFLKAGDNFWFFFAGHGTRYEDRDYLMLADSDSGNVGETAISMNYITERLRRCGADNVVLLVDACRSQGKRDGTGVGAEKQQGVITIFSCSPAQYSYEIEPLQQGAFTYALLEGLRIQGEGNCATVERLCHHLRHRVPELTQHYRRGQQNPYSMVEPASKYHLILLPRYATVQDVAALKMDALMAEAKRQYALAKQLWIRVLAVSPADWDAVEAIERLVTVSREAAPPVSRESSGLDSSGEVSPRPKASREAVPPTLREKESGKPRIPLTTVSFDVVTVDAKGKQVKRQRREAQQFTEVLPNNIELKMVPIPGGKFLMGSPETEAGRLDCESPQHEVTVPAFFMGQYPVTQAQWQAVAALQKVERDLKPASYFKGANRPVERVSWYDAEEFCKRLSRQTGRKYRLPSEAEWEYACRAEMKTPFHFGETITTELANYDGNYTYAYAPKGKYREQTTEVGSFPANAFGLYDMHGNVWEWCADDWYNNYQSAPSDGSIWLSSDKGFIARVLRGGSWFDSPRNCRSAGRHYYNPANDLSRNIGFRIVCVSLRTS